MADDILTPFFAHADIIAQRIREWNEYRLEQEIADQKRTIDVQIEKVSNTKAAEKLKKSQAWLQLKQKRFEQFKGLLFWLGGWVGSGRSGIALYLAAIFIFGGLGLMWGINTPSTIACPKDMSVCYLLRLNKSQVLLPQQIKQVLKEYERSKNQPLRRRRK